MNENPLTARTGRIMGFTGDALVIQDSEGIESVPCDPKKTLRSLHECFGDVILRRGIDAQRFIGKEIVYHVGDKGLIGFGYIEK